MDHLDFDAGADAGAGRLLIRIDRWPGTTPEANRRNAAPLYMFPGETGEARENAQWIGWEFAARPDVALRLRAHYAPRYAARETPAFAAYLAAHLAEVKAEAVLLSLPTLPVPFLPHFQKTLYPVQCQAIAFALRHPFALWAIDMGCGKTLAALYAATCMLARKSVRRWLIVSPVSGIDDAWLAEAAEASVPLCVAKGGALTAGESPFVLVGREQLLSDLRRGVVSLDALALAFDGYILDESSVVRDPNNETYRVLAYLRPEARAMLLLNGTPIENDLAELYHQIDLLAPGKLGSEAEFCSRHAGGEIASLLSGELADIMYVGRLSDTGREPPALHQKTLWVPLAPGQQAAYDALAAEFEGAGAERRLALYARLQAACNDTGLLAEEYRPGESAKRELLRELLPGLACFARKSMLYTQSRRWSEALAREFSGSMALTYLGGMTRERRRVTKGLFRDGDEPFLWCNDAALKSVNLQFVWHVVTLDLPWSAAIYQLIARARRSDTEHPVTWLRVLSDTPLERKKLALVEAKRDLLENAVHSLPAAIRQGLVDWDELL